MDVTNKIKYPILHYLVRELTHDRSSDIHKFLEATYWRKRGGALENLLSKADLN